MINLDSLVKEVEAVLADWSAKLSEQQQIAIYDGMAHGAGLFVEVVTNPSPYQIKPQIRIGIHDPHQGSIYLDKFEIALLQ